MGLYGVVADGVFTFQHYARLQVGTALKAANMPPTPQTEEELLKRINIMDTAKINLNFANDVVDRIIDNIAKLQP